MPDDDSPPRRTVIRPATGVVSAEAAAPAVAAQAELQSVLASSTHKRMRVLALIGIGLFGLGTISSVLLPPLLDKDERVRVVFTVLCAVLTLLSLGMWLLARSDRPPKHIVFFGLSYVSLAAWCMAVAEVLLRVDTEVRQEGVSGIAIWIVLFPMLVPCRPWQALLTALVCASGLPAVYLAGQLFGLTPEDGDQLVDWFAAPYVCAGLAYAAAASIHHLTRALARARERVRALGAYELEELLAAGGMGEVWRARHRLLPRPAAIKFIRGSVDGMPRQDLALRFEQEARAISRLESPHTVSLFDFGLDEEARFFYAMELLDGIELEELVLQQGAQPPARVLHILRQLCRSLGEAHALGMVHRDVKPSNIMLCTVAGEPDQVKVLDFGLVAVTQEREPTVAQDGQAGWVGTPGYMAPEIFLEEQPGTAAADVYAVGAVGYWLLCGDTVFPDGQGGEDLVAHGIDRPQHPAARLGRELPEALCAIIMRCLAKKPAARYADARELLRALEAVEGLRWGRGEAEAHEGSVGHGRVARVATQTARGG